MKESFYQKILDHRQWIWKAICIVALYMLFINPLILGADISKSAFKKINTAAVENSLKQNYSFFDGSRMDGKFAYFDSSWKGFSHPDNIKNNSISITIFVEDQPEKTSDKIQMGRQFFFYDGYIHNRVYLTKNGVEIYGSESTKTVHSKHLQQALMDVLTALGAFDETTETDEVLASLE